MSDDIINRIQELQWIIYGAECADIMQPHDFEIIRNAKAEIEALEKEFLNV